MQHYFWMHKGHHLSNVFFGCLVRSSGYKSLNISDFLAERFSLRKIWKGKHSQGNRLSNAWGFKGYSENSCLWEAVFCQKAFLRRVRFWFSMRWLQLSNVIFGLALIHYIKASRRLRGGFAECRVAYAENNFPTGAYAKASRTYYGLEGNLPEPSRWKCIQKKTLLNCLAGPSPL